MAVTSVELLFTGRGATDSYANHRTYTRVYEVLTDAPADDEQVVGNGAGVPVPGDPLDSDADAVVVDMDFQQSDDSPTIWYVTVNYDSDPPTDKTEPIKPDAPVDIDNNTITPADRQDTLDDPLAEPAQWTLTTQDSEEPAIDGIEVNRAGDLIIPGVAVWGTSTEYQRGQHIKANENVYECVVGGTSSGSGTGPSEGAEDGEIADGGVTWIFYATYVQTQDDPNYAIRSGILTSAGLPFDPPVMTEVSRVVLSVTKNMPIHTIDFLLSLKNAQNLLAWRGAGPRCAKILKIEHDGGKERNGIQYVTTKWEIGLDPDTWDVRVLDAGYGKYVTKTDYSAPGDPEYTDYERFLDRNGEPLDSPVPLNGAGAPLAPGDEPVFRRFVPRQVKLVDFNSALPF